MKILVKTKGGKAITGEMTLVCLNPDGGGMICLSYHKNFDISFENIEEIYIIQNNRLKALNLENMDCKDIFDQLSLYYFRDRGEYNFTI